MRIIWAGILCVFGATIAYAQHLRPDLEPMPTDLGPTFIEIGGEVYGAKPSDLGPIGGGEGYQRIITGGDHHVSSIDELREVLSRAQAGEVIYLEPDGDYDCTALIFAEELVLEVPAGVTLASNRGHEGSTGAVVYSDAHATLSLIKPMGPGVRITGIWLRGPKPQQHLEHHHRSFTADGAEGHSYYYRFPTSAGIVMTHDDIEVDNCVISGWTRALFVQGCQGAHIHHNYIHHCQYHGLGYGMTHSNGRSLIEYNLFNANRHSIAATGQPGDAYEARHNVELYTTSSFPFDMHGGRDRGDGTDIAGDWVKIHNNQFRATHQRAIGIRGVPQELSPIRNNWFYHESPGANVIMPWPCDDDTNIEFANNAFGETNPAVH